MFPLKVMIRIVQLFILLGRKVGVNKRSSLSINCIDNIFNIRVFFFSY
jgi:hypothetical protein